MICQNPSTVWAVVALLALISRTAGRSAEDPYKEASSYKLGQPRAALAAIEAEIRAARPDDLRTIEAQLLSLLESPTATRDSKEWACRQLRQVGSEKAVPALASLLPDKDLGTPARMALQGIPGAGADKALREALPNLQGELKTGAILALGARGDRRAAALLAPLASDLDAGVAEAALYALGQMGGDDALRAIEAATVPKGLSRYRFHAILLCAERMAAEGKEPQAETLYRNVYRQADDDDVVRIGALRGIVVCGKAKAAETVAAALRDASPRIRAAAAKFVCERGGPELRQAALAGMSSLPVDTQALLFGLLDDKAALPLLLEAARGGDEAVRAAALGAIGRVGDGTAVAPLLEVVAGGKGGVQDAARKSLGQLRGTDVEPALMAAARAGQPSTRAEAMRALASRGASGAVPMLLEAANCLDDARIQSEALFALAALADAGTLPALVKLMVGAKDDLRRTAVEVAVVATCRRLGDKDAAAAAVIAGLSGAAAEVRPALLRALANAACPRALQAVRAALKDPDAAVQGAALRVLADWPDPAATAELLEVARSARTPEEKMLALRGATRLAVLPGGPSPEEKAKLLSEAVKVAGRPEEKKMVLAALGEIRHPSALDVAVGCLADEAVEVDAAAAVVKIAKGVRQTNMEAADAAVQKVLEICKSPTARQVAESSLFVPTGLLNIASQGAATSPDGVEKDGAAGGDQAAIDGDPSTYWDEEDGKDVYRLVVTLKQPRKVAAISIMGYEHHQYAPKDFEILCDGVAVKKVADARYDSNFLVIRLDGVNCTTVELKITGYYGASPAIRELGIYRPAPGR